MPDWLESMFTGKLRRLWMAGGWMLLLFITRDCWRKMFSIFGRWVRMPAGFMMIAGGIFYTLTWPFDKGLFNLATPLNMFLEELGDSIATTLILLSGVLTWRASEQVGGRTSEFIHRSECATAENRRSGIVGRAEKVPSSAMRRDSKLLWK